MKTIVCILTVFLTFSVIAQEACFTVIVRDDKTGTPLTNAVVKASIDKRMGLGEGWGAGKPNHVEGKTDSNGSCTITGAGDFGTAGFAVFADGYYAQSGYKIVFTNKTGVVFKKWQPWNQTFTVNMQKIGNPIPMYVKRFRNTPFPKGKPPFGFDFLKGEWVAPHGNGEVADVTFSTSTESFGVITNMYGTLKLKRDNLMMLFNGDGNGVIPLRVSRHGLRLREAPFNGYLPSFTWYNERLSYKSGDVTNMDSDQCFYFRIRAKKNKKGEIVKAIYGKIYNDYGSGFDFSRISFTYYVNPTENDQNLEFDGKTNLFRPSSFDDSYGISEP